MDMLTSDELPGNLKLAGEIINVKQDCVNKVRDDGNLKERDMLSHHPMLMAKIVYGVVGLWAMVATDGWHYGRAHAEDASSLSSFEGGRCLDADLGSIGRNWTKVQLWDCWGGLNQAWIIQYSSTRAPGGAPTVSIRNAQSGRCLDLLLGVVAFPRDGVPVALADCRDDSLSQKWWFGVDQGGSTDGSIRTMLQGLDGRSLCLDADLGTIGQNGTTMQIWSCWGGLNQLWYEDFWPVAVNCDPQLTLSGLFWERYLGDRSYSPLGHALGCPTSQEVDYGNGRFQRFERGSMVFSPDTGPQSVQIGWNDGAGLQLRWAYTTPFHYDKFNVRVLWNGGYFRQDEVRGTSPTGDSGHWSFYGHLEPGLYEVSVEGCDDSGIFGTSSDCKQGFSLPVQIIVWHPQN